MGPGSHNAEAQEKRSATRATRYGADWGKEAAAIRGRGNKGKPKSPEHAAKLRALMPAVARRFRAEHGESEAYRWLGGTRGPKDKNKGGRLSDEHRKKIGATHKRVAESKDPRYYDRPAWVQAGEDRIRFHDEEGSETRLYTEHHGGIIVSRIYRKRLHEFYIKLDAQTYLVLSQARRLAHAILAAVKGRRDWYRPRRRRAIRGRR